MKNKTISASNLRSEAASVLNQVEFKAARFKIKRNGKVCAILISLDEFKYYHKTIEELEDEVDVNHAKESIEEGNRLGFTPWEEFVKELNIDV